MCIVCQTIAAGAAALTGILPVSVPEPEVAQPSAREVAPSSIQPLSISGNACKKIGQIRKTSVGSFKCVAKGRQKSWRPTQDAGAAIATTTTTTTTSTIPYRPPTEASDNIELCKIKEVSNSRGQTGAGFPEWIPLTPNSGTVKWALIPIDFSDLPGENSFQSRVDQQMRLLSEWFEVVSEGKFRVQWVVMDKWVRLPNPSSSYQIDRSSNLGDEPSGVRLWNDAMASADPHFDFTGIQTVNFILPKGQTFLRETSQGFPWDAAVRGLRTNEGSVASFSIPGVFMDQPGAEYWSYWAHEFGHAIGLSHVGLSRGTLPPFNPFDLMGGQDGPTRELSGWLRFFARWIPDERVYCKSSANLKNIEMTLVPLSGSDSGLKFVVVPVSSTKAVLIESRRVTKFSCQQSRANGVLVYTYDATLGHGEDFLKPIAPSGREKSSTNGCRAEPFPDPLLYEADKVTVEGITIEVLSLGRYDRIRLMRNS